MWTKADTDKDGRLNGMEGVRYIAFMRINGRMLVTEGTVTQPSLTDQGGHLGARHASNRTVVQKPSGGQP